MLSRHGFSPAMTELLVLHISKDLKVKVASDKKNPVSRLINMLEGILSNWSQIKLVIIDVYSTSSFWYFLACAVLLKLIGLPYITILRGGNLPLRLDRNPRLCKWLFHSAAMNVSPSVYLQEEFLSRGFQVRLIPNFIDLSNYPYLHRIHIEPRILWVRAFHRIYNPSLAIHVLAQLRKNYPGATLCMVGPDKDGSMAECRNTIVENKLEKEVVFTGKLQKSEWIQLSSEFDIFINTTNFDNMPVSVIEAMALGFPVISTNVGGIPYLIKNGENGLLVEPNDVDGFVRSIEGLMVSPVAAGQLSEKARKFAEQFSWEKVKPLWIDIINRYQRV
jgi:glycosyltransferase involved in cell wall biosynthesis